MTAPVELYEFVYGPQHYYYTGADEDIAIGAQTYAQLAIQGGAITQTQALGKQDVKLEVPRDFAIAEIFRIAPPAAPITLTIRHYDRAQPAVDPTVAWMGRVMSAEWGELTATLACQSALTALKRPGLRRHYQIGCPHVLYGVDCLASAAAKKTTATIANIDGAQLTAAAFAAEADGWWVGGYVQYLAHNGVLLRRGVTGHAGDTITLAQLIPGLAAGQNVDAFPGCAHTLAVCDAKFDNAVNYGGFKWIPQKNPFSDQVY